MDVVPSWLVAAEAVIRLVHVPPVAVSEFLEWCCVRLLRLESRHGDLNIDHRLRRQAAHSRRTDVLDPHRCLAERMAQPGCLGSEERRPTRVVRHDNDHIVTRTGFPQVLPPRTSGPPRIAPCTPLGPRVQTRATCVRRAPRTSIGWPPRPPRVGRAPRP